uniref:Plastocyanin-like domain-containing protein n=1 Tax=Oryza punctata TaxID=4537 RepID=A0A0E0JII5_ORYPU
MTVVEIDATYTKPFAASTVQLSPGQTMNVLISADQSPARYFMVAKPFNDVPITADNKTATAILQYTGVPTSVVPALPQLMPATNSTGFVAAFHDKLRSLNSPRYPADVPLTVDRHLLYTIGLNIDPCETCLNRSHLAASLNNITFVMPRTALLQAHYYGQKGVFAADFPDRPPARFNYTGVPLTAGLGTSLGMRLSKIAYNATVELVLQDTNLLSVESHPFHLHGYNFFVVGRGVGNFDPATDPAKDRPSQVALDRDKVAASSSSLVSGTPPLRVDLNKVREAKRYAVFQAQREGCLGSYKSFDSSFGNYLVPVIPSNDFFVQITNK